MRIIKTMIWIVITAVLVAFIAMNWDKAPVNIWPGETGYYHLEWPVGFIALFFFLLGLLPTWLLAKAGKWRMNRRINALENSVRAATTPPPPPSPPSPLLGTSTQLEALSTEEPQA